MKLLALLFFVASVYAKGGRGRGGSSGSGTDNWHAPWETKATFAAYLIWAILSFFQFIIILSNLKKIPNARARLPFILLSLVTLFTTVAYGCWAAFIRAGTDTLVETKTLDQLADAVNFFLIFNFPGHAAVLLWLAHQRAAVFQSTQPFNEKGLKPVLLRFWKKCLDWALVFVLWALALSAMAIYAAQMALWDSGSLSNSGWYKYRDVYNGFSHAIAGMGIIVAADVLVTQIALYSREHKARFADPVTSRTLFAAVILALYAIEWLAVEIYEFTAAQHDPTLNWNYIYFFQSVFEGLCTILTTALILLTMSLPNVQWAPSTPVAPNAAWNQPSWNPASQGPGYAPNYPPSYYTGGYASPPVPTPSPGAFQQGGRPGEPQPFVIPMKVDHA